MEMKWTFNFDLISHLNIFNLILGLILFGLIRLNRFDLNQTSLDVFYNINRSSRPYLGLLTYIFDLKQTSLTSRNIYCFICTAFDSILLDLFDSIFYFKFGLLIFGLKQTPPNPNPNPRHIDFVADKPSLDDVHFQIRIFRSIKQGL